MRPLLIGLWMTGVATAAHTPAVYAGEKIDKTLAVDASGLVRMAAARGRIDVLGWDRNDVSVAGTLDDLTKSVTFETSGSTTTFSVATPDNLNRGEGSKLLIHVPAASRLRVEVVSADVSMKGVRGGIDCNSVSGDVDASDLPGRIDIATVSGHIELARAEAAEGATTLSSVSGDIEAETDAEVLTVKTVSGDADVRSGKRVKALNLNAISGDIEISADLADGARVKGSTTSGDIKLSLNRDVGAVVELRANSGDIRNTLTSDRAKQGMFGGKELQFTMGNGTGTIEMTTISGDLQLLAR